MAYAAYSSSQTMASRHLPQLAADSSAMWIKGLATMDEMVHVFVQTEGLLPKSEACWASSAQL